MNVATVLRALLYATGITAALIALSIIILGPDLTLAACAHAFDSLAGRTSQAAPQPNREMDSELRFYASMWFGYGVLLILAAHNLNQRRHWVPWLAAVFFLGGAGRVFSLLTVGEPHPFFFLLMGLELLLPPILVWLVGAGVRSRARV